MTIASAYSSRTKTIGDELVRLIKASSFGSTCEVVQLGGVEMLSNPQRVGDMIPGIIVEPTSSEPSDELALGVNGTQDAVVENFRIGVFINLSPNDNPFTELNTAASSVVAALNDLKLSGIASSMLPSMVERSAWNGTEWSPEEALFLTGAAQNAKVVVIRWKVIWLSR